MKVTCTVNTILWNQPLKGGLHDVRIRVTYLRQSKYFSLGIHVSKANWDITTKRIYPTKTFQSENAIIAEYEARAKKIAYEYMYLSVPFSFDDFAKKLFPNYQLGNNSAKIVDYLQSKQLLHEKNGKISSSDSRKALANWMIKSNLFNKFDNCTTETIHSLVDYIRKNNATVKPNTIKLYVSLLSRTFREAKKEGVCPQGIDPFINFEIKIDTTTQKRAISANDLHRIFNYKCSKIKDQFHKELFELSFYLRGINIADIIRLPNNCIEDSRLTYTRKKTKHTYSIKIHPRAAEIIEKHKAIEGPYLFPILKPGINERQMKNKTSDTTKMLSKVLGNICDELKIPGGKSVTFYAARHSYATHLLHSGADFAVIKSAMGHSSFTTTEKYLKDLDKSFIDDADDKIFNK